MPNIDPDDSNELDHQRKLRDTHRSNLRKLQEQRAQYGIGPPIHLINAIEREQAAIQEAEAALRAMGAPPQERLQQQQEDTRIAKDGFDALRELTRRPEVREELNALRADLYAAQRQIALMTAYKKLHDHFQELESCYNTIHHFIYRNNQLVATDHLPWESLEHSELQLETHIIALLDCATGPELAAEHGAWQQQLERARNDLHGSIATLDAVLLKRATKAIRDICSNQPSRINDRMFGAVRTLRELNPGEKFQVLRDRLMQLTLDPVEHRLALRFNKGIHALGRLSEQLVQAIDWHNDFQEVDNQLRLIETTIEQDISGLLDAWADLHQYSSRLCERNGEKWSIQFTAINVELEHTLEQHIVSDIVRCFRKYRSQAGRYFNEVDSSLLRLCNDLTTFGGSLAPLLEVL